MGDGTGAASVGSSTHAGKRRKRKRRRPPAKEGTGDNRSNFEKVGADSAASSAAGSAAARSLSYKFVAREEREGDDGRADDEKNEVPYFPGDDLEAVAERALREGVREWEMDMPPGESDAAESFHLAAQHALKVHAKYRYGAVLVTGSDYMPLRSGSNSKPFKRKEIHAEAATLKVQQSIHSIATNQFVQFVEKKCFACACICIAIHPNQGSPPGLAKGKTILIARVPPRTKKAVSATASATGNAESSKPATSRQQRYLNARPCEKCYAKMTKFGVRMCAFTTAQRGRIGCLLLEEAVSSGNNTEQKFQKSSAGKNRIRKANGAKKPKKKMGFVRI